MRIVLVGGRLRAVAGRADAGRAVPLPRRPQRSRGRGRSAAIRSVPELYRRNGLQFLPFTTLYQLAAERASRPSRPHDTALLIPDALAFQLTGQRLAERTNASTTGRVRLRDGAWDRRAVRRPRHPRGDPPAPRRPRRADRRSAPAVAADLGGNPRRADRGRVARHRLRGGGVPMARTRDQRLHLLRHVGARGSRAGDAGRLGCGARGELHERAGRGRAASGFLHNVMGLWLLSESVRQWEKGDGEAIDLPTLLGDAAEVADPGPVFDANDPRFLAPATCPGGSPRGIASALSRRPRPVRRSRARSSRASRRPSRRPCTRHPLSAGRETRTIPHRRRRRASIVFCANARPIVPASRCWPDPSRRRPRQRAGPGAGDGARDGSLEALRDLVARTTTSPRRFVPRA